MLPGWPGPRGACVPPHPRETMAREHGCGSHLGCAEPGRSDVVHDGRVLAARAWCGRVARLRRWTHTQSARRVHFLFPGIDVFDFHEQPKQPRGAGAVLRLLRIFKNIVEMFK